LAQLEKTKGRVIDPAFFISNRSNQD